MTPPTTPAQPAATPAANAVTGGATGPLLALPRTPGQPDWLRSLRQQAMARFEAVGFPTSKTEEWRFTALSPITQTPYIASAGQDVPMPPDLDDHLATWRLDDAYTRLVCVNGRFLPGLSSPLDQPGVTLGPLDELARRRPDDLRTLLTQPTRHDDPLTHLNLAMADQGLVLLVDQGVTLDRPIHLLSVALPLAGRPWMAHSRHLVALGHGARAQLIEHHVALPGDGAYWRNDVTQITLADDAHAGHHLINHDSDQGVHVTTLLATLGQRSDLASHTALFGGRLVRNNIHVELRGPHAHALVNGLFVGHGRRTLDNHMRVVHGAPQGASRQFYKGVLADHAQGVFTGRIVVERDAQKTDAKQTSRNLLLDDTARLHTNPQLEIDADDVKCTHGATTGQLDADALFYLRSRGISLANARAMLIRAFAAESLHRITLPAVADHLGHLLSAAMSTALAATTSTTTSTPATAKESAS